MYINCSKTANETYFKIVITYNESKYEHLMKMSSVYGLGCVKTPVLPSFFFLFLTFISKNT